MPKGIAEIAVKEYEVLLIDGVCKFDQDYVDEVGE